MFHKDLSYAQGCYHQSYCLHEVIFEKKKKKKKKKKKNYFAHDMLRKHLLTCPNMFQAII